MTPHNEANKNEIAKTVLMPGDPLRAKYIAENYLTDIKLVNKVRNVFAYTGFYKGKEITIMASGMGMPSMGIYSYELYKFYDVENIIRIGSAGSYNPNLKLFDVVLTTSAYTKSSYAKVQGLDTDTLEASSTLNKVIEETALKTGSNIIKGTIYSTDVFYNDEDDINDLYSNKNCQCVEMESFALFYNAKKLNKNASCILTISDNLITGKKATPDERRQAFNNMIKLALESAISL